MADAGTDPLATTAGWGRWRTPFLLLIVGSVIAGVALRFVTRSPLWLDEALSVNIASLPLGEIPGALRRDGHPPLYYGLLHGWMEVFGRGPVAVRALSGIWSVLLLPLLWMAGRRLGGRRVASFAVAIGALSPYAIRYGTETRMYAMVSVLALAGWLLVDDALARPARWRLAAIAAVTAALLWTHYWAIWLLAATTIALVAAIWRARRAGRDGDARTSASVLAAMVVGGLAFVPWVPTLLYQSARTGTPWARVVRPTEMVTFTVADLGGGPDSEAVLLGWLLVMAAVVGVFGRAASRSEVVVELRMRARARPLFVAVAGTAAVGWVASWAGGATYLGRYAAVFFPFVVLLAALGLDQLRSRPVVVAALAVLVVLGGIGGVRNVVFERSDAARTAAALDERGEPGDVVVYCPDQLGPSSSRLVADGFDQVTYPSFAGPERIDWVDYGDRLAAADPERFAEELVERAGDRRIFLVYSNAYSTHAEVCPALFNAIGARRPAEVLTQLGGAYEPASAVVFEAQDP